MFHIGIDIGGTFTDCVLIGADADGQVTAYRTAKTLSTPADPADGVMAGLAELAASVGRSRPDLLAQAERFGHGTTIGTNAVLERTGARVGVITTAGHGDALAIMRGHGRVAGRPLEDVFRVRGTSLPAPLIVPGAVLELHERVDAAGQVVVALDVLAHHPAIAEVAVVGVPDPVFGERVRAVAVLRPGERLSVEALRDWAGPRLADYKQPAELVTVGALPRNANGKVMKKQLAGDGT